MADKKVTYDRGIKQTETRKKNTSEAMKRWWADRKAMGGDNRR